MLSHPGFDRLGALIADHERIVLTTHLHPDGDGLGAQVAMLEYLHQLGKQVEVANPSRRPDNLAFLDETRVS